MLSVAGSQAMEMLSYVTAVTSTALLLTLGATESGIRVLTVRQPRWTGYSQTRSVPTKAMTNMQ